MGKKKNDSDYITIPIDDTISMTPVKATFSCATGL